MTAASAVEEIPLSASPRREKLSAAAPATVSSPPGPTQSRNPNSFAVPRRTRKQEIEGNVQVLVLSLVALVNGWNDGTLGPLIPRIQEVYHLDYTIVSLLFVFRCLGCLLGSLVTILFASRLGLGKACRGPRTTHSMAKSPKGAIIRSVSNVIQVLVMLPYPVFVLGAFINGLGYAIQAGQTMGYIAGMPDANGVKMGVFQSAYGLGALIAPLVATQFAQKAHWSYHYIITAGISVVSALVFYAVFRGRTQEECLTRIGYSAQDDTKNAVLPSPAGTSTPRQRSRLRQIIFSQAVHTLAVFLFVYVGTEVTIGGWVVSFMIAVRGGGASSGYVSTGFFAGMMSGRLLLIPINKLIGHARAVYLYGALAIGLELIIWLVPSFLGSALSVSIVGILLGPLYPLALAHATLVFPPHLLSGSISWVSGFATCGSALLPFATGAIAARAGIRALEPVVVGMLTCMLILWAMVLRTRPHI
ncbi:MFS domain-containing protein [Mycena chlorophos]|uniref:MFS domain-containing protein n=1 Tax=Mycena chlorophos TaxID=658473 RepID=A0A8H6VVL9_MYCCL|nr:MFS domain-containing protein [Mycena chlorophos]